MRNCLHASLRQSWLAALSIAVACADDGATSPGDTDTDTDTESSSSEPTTVTITSADTTTSPTTTLTTTTTETATESSESSSTLDTSSGSESTGDPCGNGAIDDGEVCDGDALGDATCESEGFATGTLACAADCSAYDTSMCNACGNDVVDDGEVCDGTDLGVETCTSLGFDAGDIACAVDCTYDTGACIMFSCGDGVVNDPREQCDGKDIPTDCMTEGFGAGTITCTGTCQLDLTACCGDGNIGGSELCDAADLGGQTCADQEGFDDGVLACAADCTFDVSQCTTCGDATIEGDEQCEGDDLAGNDCTTVPGGFVAGTLACNACQFDTSGCNFCGNDFVDPGEDCDGTALGGSSCLDLGFTGGVVGCFEDCSYDTEQCTNFQPPGIGDVVITEIMRNPTSIPDASGEWFEIVNTSLTETWQLNGCVFQDDGGDDFPIDVDMPIGPGEIITFANDANPGFTPDFVYGGMNLANAEDEVELFCDGISIDRVAYDDPLMMGVFPGTAGAAMQLDSAVIDAVSNDDGTNWCSAFTPYFMTDTGTPGAANDSCAPPTFDIDFCVLQFPTSINEVEGTAVDVFGRLYIEGQTDQTPMNDPAANIQGWVGYGPDGSDPAVDLTWVWTAAVPNPAWVGMGNPDVNNDEYMASMIVPIPGDYDYAYRFSGDGGSTFTYCDDAGNGSSDNYAAADAGQMTTTAGGDQTVLYFSEYHEGTSSFKAVEIHNPSNLSVNLTGCSIIHYFNGSMVPSAPINLIGLVGPDDVFTLCQPTLHAVVPGGCDATSNSLNFNGDDVVELRCGGTQLDVFGQIGVDPGTEWSANGVGTADENLRRDCAFQVGDNNGVDAFDPSAQWDTFALDGMTGYNIADLGQHVCP